MEPKRARTATSNPDDAADERVRPPFESASTGRMSAADLSGLAIAGLSRRRVAWILAVIVSVWIVAIFARQVGEAARAGDRAETLRLENATLVSQVDDLQKELDLIGREAFIEQQARAYGLGDKAERPFTLAPDASPLPDDAPGSAAVRLGAEAERTAPLDVWLDLLFGPSR
jgi:cell division protein FtsB